MKKILWQTRTRVTAGSFRDRCLSPVANGGNAYDYFAAMALSETYDVQMSEAALVQAGESTWSYWLRMRKDRPEADVVVCEPYPIVFARRYPGIRRIGMIHHIDDDLGRSSFGHSWFFRRLKRRLTELDMVITVSVYWKKYLEEIGCPRVKVIYNSFDPAAYAVGRQDIAEFRGRHGIPADRPVVYIGNAARQKGVYDVYEALKEKPYYLLMSGPRNLAPDLPVHYLAVDRKDYLTMLAAAEAVVVFSRMTEGWNRVAHEALLCGTPVVGSGVGGMRELLEGAGQRISPEASGLAEAVADVIQQRAHYVSRGQAFVRQFDMEYFRAAWLQALQEVTGQ